MTKADDKRRRDMTFGAQAIAFLQAGGTVEEANAIVDRAAEELAKRGHKGAAHDTGHQPDASPSRGEDAGGQGAFADKARLDASPASSSSQQISSQPNGDVGVPRDDADSAAEELPPTSPTHREREATQVMPQPASLGLPSAREPSDEQRSNSARNAQMLAQQLMAQRKIDGRDLRDWGLAEGERASKRKGIESYLLAAAARKVREKWANPDSAMTYGELLSDVEIMTVYQQAEIIGES
jgi:hypothetical protein